MAEELAEPLAKLAAMVVDAAVRLRIRYMVTGMFAGNYWLGKADIRERPSYDVDFSIFAPRDHLEVLAREIQARHGWVRRRDTPEQILLRVSDTGFGVDLLKAVLPEDVASPEEAALVRFFESAYARSVVRERGGREMRISRPEDLIIVKVLLSRPKDVVDIRLLAQLPDLDRAYLLQQLHDLGFAEKYQQIAGDVRPVARPGERAVARGHGPGGAARRSKPKRAAPAGLKPVFRRV